MSPTIEIVTSAYRLDEYMVWGVPCNQRVQIQPLKNISPATFEPLPITGVPYEISKRASLFLYGKFHIVEVANLSNYSMSCPPSRETSVFRVPSSNWAFPVTNVPPTKLTNRQRQVERYFWRWCALLFSCLFFSFLFVRKWNIQIWRSLSYKSHLPLKPPPLPALYYFFLKKILAKYKNKEKGKNITSKIQFHIIIHSALRIITD